LALSLNGNDTAALYILGDIRYNSGNLEGAKDLWTKLIKIQPDFIYADDLKKRMEKAETEIRVEKEYRSLGMDHSI
jgi:tetratricopeptide (TPR) repeat protein